MTLHPPQFSILHAPALTFSISPRFAFLFLLLFAPLLSFNRWFSDLTRRNVSGFQRISGN